MFYFKANWIKKEKKRPSFVVVRGEVWISLCYLCRGMSVMHLPTSREKAVTGRFSVKVRGGGDCSGLKLLLEKLSLGTARSIV